MGKTGITEFVSKPKGKISLERPRQRWKDINIDLMEIRSEGMDWINLVQDRFQWQSFVNNVMKLSGTINGRKFLD
jgi:hypothetical protein